VIADFDMVEIMLRYFIRKVHNQGVMMPKPRVVIGIPSGVTEVEKRAAHDRRHQRGGARSLPGRRAHGRRHRRRPTRPGAHRPA